MTKKRKSLADGKFETSNKEKIMKLDEQDNQSVNDTEMNETLSDEKKEIEQLRSQPEPVKLKADNIRTQLPVTNQINGYTQSPLDTKFPKGEYHYPEKNQLLLISPTRLRSQSLSMPKQPKIISNTQTRQPNEISNDETNRIRQLRTQSDPVQRKDNDIGTPLHVKDASTKIHEMKNKNFSISLLKILSSGYFLLYWWFNKKSNPESKQTEQIETIVNQTKKIYIELYMNYKKHSQIKVPELRIDLNASIDFNNSTHWLLLHDNFYRDKNLWLIQHLYNWSIGQSWREFQLVILNSNPTPLSTHLSTESLITAAQYYKNKTLWIYDFTDSKLSDNDILVINSTYSINSTLLMISSGNFSIIVITRKDHASLLPIEKNIFNINNTVEINSLSQNISRNYLQVCTQNLNYSTLPFGSCYRVLESWYPRNNAFKNVLSNPGTIPLVCQYWPELFNYNFKKQRSLFYFLNQFIKHIITDNIAARLFYQPAQPSITQLTLMMDTFSCLIYNLGELETLSIKSGIINITHCNSNNLFDQESVLQLGLFKRKLNNNGFHYYVDDTFASLFRSYYFSQDISRLNKQIENFKNRVKQNSQLSQKISPWVITHLINTTNQLQNLEIFLNSIFEVNGSLTITTKNLDAAISYANELYEQDINKIIIRKFINAIIEFIKPHIINFATPTTQDHDRENMLSALKEGPIFRENLYDKINMTNRLLDPNFAKYLLPLLKEAGLSYNSERRNAILNLRDRHSKGAPIYNLAHDIDFQFYDTSFENISNDTIFQYQNIIFTTRTNQSNFNQLQFTNSIHGSLSSLQTFIDFLFKTGILTTNLLGGCSHRIIEEQIFQMIYHRIKKYVNHEELLHLFIHCVVSLLSFPNFDNYSSFIFVYRIVSALPLNYFLRENSITLKAMATLMIALSHFKEINCYTIGYIMADIGYRLVNNALTLEAPIPSINFVNNQKNQNPVHERVNISTNRWSFYSPWSSNFFGKIQRTLDYLSNARQFFR